MHSMGRDKTGLAVFVTLSILYFFSIFHRVGTASIATNLVTDFNTDNSVLGLMSGMYFYSYAAAQIPVGIMLDKIGTRKTLTILGIIASCGNLLFSLSPTVTILALGRALIGFGNHGNFAAAGHGRRGVVDQVEKNLLQLSGVAPDPGQIFTQF